MNNRDELAARLQTLTTTEIQAVIDSLRPRKSYLIYFVLALANDAKVSELLDGFRDEDDCARVADDALGPVEESL